MDAALSKVHSEPQTGLPLAETVKELDLETTLLYVLCQGSRSYEYPTGYYFWRLCQLGKSCIVCYGSVWCAVSE